MRCRSRETSLYGQTLIRQNAAVRGFLFCTKCVRDKHRFRSSLRSDEKVLHYIVLLLLLLLSFYIILRRIFLSQSINCTHTRTVQTRTIMYVLTPLPEYFTAYKLIHNNTNAPSDSCNDRGKGGHSV